MREAFGKIAQAYETVKKSAKEKWEGFKQKFEGTKTEMSQEVLKAESPEDLIALGKKLQAQGETLVAEREDARNAAEEVNDRKEDLTRLEMDAWNEAHKEKKEREIWDEAHKENAEKKEAERVAAEKVEAERLEAERVAAEQAETKRVAEQAAHEEHVKQTQAAEQTRLAEIRAALSGEEAVVENVQSVENSNEKPANAWEMLGVDKDTAEKLLTTNELTSIERKIDLNNERDKQEYQTKVVDNRLLRRDIERSLRRKFNNDSITDEEKDLFLKSITKEVSTTHWSSHIGNDEKKLLNNKEVLQAIANSDSRGNREWAQDRAKELGLDLAA